MSTTQLSTMEVATTLIDLCRQGKNHDAIRDLYADDIVSLEAGSMPGMPQEVTGRDAVVAKGMAWMEAHDVHDAQVTGPWPNGDQFIVNFRYEVTNKPSGQRFVMEEAALFTVRDGKIAREVFFYPTGN
jgi:ketosteroid isomerase-like protein